MAKDSMQFASFIDKITDCVGAYGKLMDVISEGDVFEKIVQGLVKSRRGNLSKAEKYIEEASLLWMRSRDDIRTDTSNVYSWCSDALKSLPDFLDSWNGEPNSIELKLLREILQEGQSVILSAIELLQGCSKQLSEARSRMVCVSGHQQAGLQELLTETDEAVGKRRAAVYPRVLLGTAPLACALILGFPPVATAGLGLCGMAAAFTTAFKIVEGSQVPILHKLRDDAKAGYEDVIEAIKETRKTTDEVKEISEKEIENMQAVRRDVRYPRKRDIGDWDENAIHKLKKAVRDCLETCKSYIVEKDKVRKAQNECECI